MDEKRVEEVPGKMQDKRFDSCPACRRVFRIKRQRNYCPFCGIKIPLLA
ncbi:hypothetical protein NZD89_05060 [Alicyclobacillus fastidiosus]|uniref:Zinc ribbon domain-containing protein n=1 Tax=Alicyclobacillus fastidiosus TaxID=392011 RepID=A0ABY6ZJY9_9BACL|nr:hypothetical protein [Alicyclobacillus fastidiosus]WAH42802.1 hypothetical protein NZD89_05060 [Alicyclobacillus fastidiosus]